MLTRKLLTGTAVLVVATLLLSLPAAAQSINVYAAPRFEPAVNELEELPEDGRKDFPMVVDFRIMGQFFCGTEQQVAVEVQPVTHPDWAGMSLVPDDARTVTFTIPVGNHNDYSDSQPGPTANLAWDTEGAPPNHTHRYVVNVDNPALSGDSTDCVPSIANAPKDTGQALLNITYPFADGGGGDEEVPCDQDPEQEKCQTTGPAENGGDSPGLGALVAVAAVIGVVLLRRRQDL